MNKTCDPALHRVAGWLLRDLDFSKIPLADAAATDDGRAEHKKPRVFANGTILTMRDGKFSPVHALAVRDGKILCAGTVAEAQAAAGADFDAVDLQGGCVLPGFIEPHVHLVMSALANHALVKLSPAYAPTFDAVIAALRSKAEAEGSRVAEGGWICGYGFDASRAGGDGKTSAVPPLSREVLDARVTPQLPVFVLNQTGKIGYVNSRALQVAGVTEANADASFKKGPDGRLNGIIVDDAIQRIALLVPQPSPSDMVAFCRETLWQWARAGCTSIYDAGIGTSSSTEIQLVNIASDNAPVRIYGALSNTTLPSDPNKVPLVRAPIHLGKAQVQAIAFWADGTVDSFGAALNRPYTNKAPPGTPSFGSLIYPDENALYTAMAPWSRAGFQLLVHAHGDRAVQQTLNVYDALLSRNPPVKHAGMHRIDHVVVEDRLQVQRALQLGLGVSHTVGYVRSWGETLDPYLFTKGRENRIIPLASGSKSESRWSLHSDSPVTPVSPLTSIDIAVSRRTTPSGHQIDADECVDLLTALHGVTIYPAEQIGIADKVGRLEVGSWADMVVLDKDLRAMNEKDWQSIQVKQTWVAGELKHGS